MTPPAIGSIGAALFERVPDGYKLMAARQGALDATETMPSFTKAFLIPHLAELHAQYSGFDFELAADRRQASLTRREAGLRMAS